MLSCGALYVGLEEQDFEREPENYEWFGHEFNKMREEMGLSTWTNTQEVLKGFLHHESIDRLTNEAPPEVVR